MREDDDVGALGELDVGGEDLSPDRRDERLGARDEQVVDEDGLAPAEREGGRHVPRADDADLHMSSESMDEVARPHAGARRRHQDWLKKPFSMSSAFSSAEICTLRGVSMKTLWAMRCMPPSSA